MELPHLSGTRDTYQAATWERDRNPLMTGLLVAFWATPDMGASHLLFALASSGYIAVGVMFEERDLRRTFGESYEAYAARVPALLPGLPRRRERARSLTA